MNYLEPWQMEGEDALEIEVLGTKVAWTVRDDVFVHTEDKTEREDGYILIGQLEWVDTPDDPADDAGYNVCRLREFVLAWKKKHYTMHNASHLPALATEVKQSGGTR